MYICMQYIQEYILVRLQEVEAKGRTVIQAKHL